MIAIPGLAQLQREALRGIEVGKMIFIERLPVAVTLPPGRRALLRQVLGLGHDPASTSTTHDGSQGHPAFESTTPRIYIVSRVMRDGFDARITDLEVVRLRYQSHASPTCHNAFQIHGKTCCTVHEATCATCVERFRLTDLVTSPHYRLTMDPDGDVIRKREFTFVLFAGDHTCIADCDRGFLRHSICPNLTIGFTIPDLVRDIGFLMPFVCPVCIGTDHLREQVTLQSQLIDDDRVGLEALLRYYRLLQRRRAELGYRHEVFGELDWDYLYPLGTHDDTDNQSAITSQSSDEHEGAEEFWRTMRDPNSYVPARPISAAALADLPRREYESGLFAVGDTTCKICLSDFEEDTDPDEGVFLPPSSTKRDPTKLPKHSETLLMKLPCGHFHFHDSCATTWLRQNHTCPLCRKPAGPEETEEVRAPRSTDGRHPTVDLDDAILISPRFQPGLISSPPIRRRRLRLDRSSPPDAFTRTASRAQENDIAWPRMTSAADSPLDTPGVLFSLGPSIGLSAEEHALLYRVTRQREILAHRLEVLFGEEADGLNLSWAARRAQFGEPYPPEVTSYMNDFYNYRIWDVRGEWVTEFVPAPIAVTYGWVPRSQ